MQQNRFEDFDKQMSKEIMKAFEGKIVDTICSQCNGSGKINKSITPYMPETGRIVAPPTLVTKTCGNCKGEGHYLIQY